MQFEQHQDSRLLRRGGSEKEPVVTDVFGETDARRRLDAVSDLNPLAMPLLGALIGPRLILPGLSVRTVWMNNLLPGW